MKFKTIKSITKREILPGSVVAIGPRIDIRPSVEHQIASRCGDLEYKACIEFKRSPRALAVYEEMKLRPMTISDVRVFMNETFGRPAGNNAGNAVAVLKDRGLIRPVGHGTNSRGRRVKTYGAINGTD